MGKFYVFVKNKITDKEPDEFEFIKTIDAENKKVAIELAKKELGQDIKVFNERQYHYFFEMD
jgi:hypothetical protein